MSDSPFWIGDGFCHDETNNEGCNYDGGDCCGPNVNTLWCTNCICYEDWNCTTPFDLIGNGFCNDESNNADCIFDGGDCCGHCINENHCSECVCLGGVSGNGLISNVLVGNQVCNDETNNSECNFDGGDCCSNLEMVANGFCNDETNTASCFYDGGDCCINVKTDYCSNCSCLMGAIASPGYPVQYDNDIDLTWIIEVAREELIEIRFQSFDVEFDPTCK